MAFSIRIDKEKKIHLRVLTEMEVLERTEEEIMHPLHELEIFTPFKPLQGFDVQRSK